MTYPEAIDFLYQRLPMFSRDGAAAIKKDLTNTHALCSALGNPEKKFKSIHIAGTNGKGSSSHMLAAVLQSAGYKTGLYTSPHLLDFRERIRLNGQFVETDFVVRFVEEQKDLIEKIAPSFFEVTVAMAFEYFATQQVDIAVIETGLGGRLDSTNVIQPLVSLITNVDYDHMNLLGDSLEEIASEKAGIIKVNTPVVLSEYQASTESVFKDKAIAMNAPLYLAENHWQLTKTERGTDYQQLRLIQNRRDESAIQVRLDLTGSYQQKNVLGVLEVLRLLDGLGFPVTIQQIQNGLSEVQKLTGLMGRWQKLGDRPAIICDTGHNPAGIAEVIENIRLQSFDKLHIVFGVMRDKDLQHLLPQLPSYAFYYYCAPDMPRAMPASELERAARLNNLSGKVYLTVQDGVKAALEAASEDDLIFIGGSTFVVAEAIPLFN